jgi:hypothetical protein
MGLFDRFSRPLERDAFARKMTEILRRAGESRPIRYRKEEFELEIGGDGGEHMFLGNAYDDYLAAPRGRRESVIERYAHAAREAASPPPVPDDFEEARRALRPRLRERSYLDVRRLLLRLRNRDADDLPHRPLGDDLVVTLVIDLPNSMMEISGETLARWDVTFEQALGAARQNLRTASAGRLEPAAPGVWASPWKDNYDASRLLLPELLEGMGLKGDAVAMVPNRDTLLLAGSEDPRGLATMVSLAEPLLSGPRPMTGFALRLEEHVWVPFSPDRLDPVRRLLNRLRVVSRARDYGEQKGLLEKLHEKEGQDLYVGSYAAVQSPEGEVSSYGVWSKGVATLLPEADQVAFVRPDEPKDRRVAGMAPWGIVRKVAGGLMSAQSMFPERWRVDEFPTEAQLAAMLQGPLAR